MTLRKMLLVWGLTAVTVALVSVIIVRRTVLVRHSPLVTHYFYDEHENLRYTCYARLMPTEPQLNEPVWLVRRMDYGADGKWKPPAVYAGLWGFDQRCSERETLRFTTPPEAEPAP